ncbi:MAG: M24 family metallopeptidase, partial [Candidatus Zixiibacteriota bacterium]
KKLQKIVQKENLNLLLITNLSNVRYLSGYTGTNGLVLISPNGSVFLTDFRYKEQVREQVKHLKVVIAQRELVQTLPTLSLFKGRRLKLGFEQNHLTCGTYHKLKALLPDCLFVPTENLVESISVTKNQDEIDRIKKAVAITDQVFSEILDFIKPQVKERDIAAEIEYRFKRYGSTTPLYETIVASGKRSALPHGRASGKRIQKGELVTLDMGAVYDGYTADLTRTVVVGKANKRQKKVYNIVLKAQKQATSKVKPKMRACDLDKVSRGLIKRAGYGKYFGHGLGHGIGLSIHDNPAINPRNQQLLEAGMVITIEPGIYIPNWGGIRIEDDVLVTKGGCEILTKTEKELLEL